MEEHDLHPLPVPARADEHEWKELLAIDGTDANFVRFLPRLRIAAHVVVPARPHFEDAVLYFANYGDPWLGDTPPIPGERPVHVRSRRKSKAPWTR